LNRFTLIKLTDLLYGYPFNSAKNRSAAPLYAAGGIALQIFVKISVKCRVAELNG